MSATQTDFVSDAITYHASLANEWERRYRKRSFQMRQTVLQKSLDGRELDGTFWLDAGCGTGTHSRWLAARGCSVIGVDAASEMVTAARSVTAENYSDRLSFFWVQSLVRSDTQRALLFDMDTAIQRLNATHADDAARRSLVGCYHNLLRTWSET